MCCVGCVRFLMQKICKLIESDSEMTEDAVIVVLGGCLATSDDLMTSALILAVL